MSRDQALHHLSPKEQLWSSALYLCTLPMVVPIVVHAGTNGATVLALALAAMFSATLVIETYRAICILRADGGGYLRYYSLTSRLMGEAFSPLLIKKAMDDLEWSKVLRRRIVVGYLVGEMLLVGAMLLMLG